MEHLSGMIWYATWPVIIYMSYKFVELNLRHFAKMERLEELEAKFEKNKEMQV
ncbi:hypothetical protein [Sulfurimonas sp. HSL3-7]|uniref:hypothetical protein n=1 Tax=Sulfonitrofixus jiaomeiensis TaxID=3131938 RepID=UPI0031F9FF5D